MPTRFTASRRRNPGTQAQAPASPGPARARQSRQSGARRLLSHVHFQNSARNQAPSGAAPYGYSAPAQQTGGGGVPGQANNEESWFERAKQKMSEMHGNEDDTGEGVQDDQGNDGDDGEGDNGEESWFEKAKGMLTGDNNDGDNGQAAEDDQGDGNGEGSWHDWLTGDDNENGEEGGWLDWLSNEIGGQGDEEQQQ